MDSYYDGIAEGYELLYGAEQQDKLSFIWDHLVSLLPQNRSHMTLLDVGCGSGISSTFWIDKGFLPKHIIGIDPSKELLAFAKRKNTGINFLQGTVETFAPAESYDIVVSLTAAQNFADISQGVHAIASVGKRLWIITIIKNSKHVEQLRNQIKMHFSGYAIQELMQEKDVIFIIRA